MRKKGWTCRWAGAIIARLRAGGRRGKGRGEAMASKKRRRRHFVIGKDFRTDGKERLTKGDDFIVHGGTEITHEETVDVVNEFSKRLAREGFPEVSEAAQILREVLYERRRRN